MLLSAAGDLLNRERSTNDDSRPGDLTGDAGMESRVVAFLPELTDRASKIGAIFVACFGVSLSLLLQNYRCGGAASRITAPSPSLMIISANRST